MDGEEEHHHDRNRNGDQPGALRELRPDHDDADDPGGERAEPVDRHAAPPSP